MGELAVLGDFQQLVNAYEHRRSATMCKGIRVMVHFRARLSLPNRPNSLVGYGRVDHRVADRLMPHEGLQCTGINTTACQRVSGAVPQHVGMNAEFEACG